jgi:hypothetical protein
MHKASTFFSVLHAVTYTCLIGFSSIFYISVEAQVLPDAGSIQQSIDQERRQNPLPQKVDKEGMPEPIELQLGGVRFTISKVQVKGKTLLSDSQINVLIDPYLNHLIDFSDLQRLSYEIEASYRISGHLVRVRLPPQDITDGVLVMEFEESIFGSVKIEKQTSRVRPRQVEDYITSQQKSGALVNLNHLDRGLLLLDDLPGVTVSGALIQGEGAFRTDLSVTVSDEPLAFADLQLDNTGPSYTGANRVLGNASLRSPLGFGDLLTATYLYSEGSQYGRVSYSAPVGHDGLRLGVNASTMGYRLVSSQFVGLGSTGSATTAGLEASYPLIRSRTANLYVGLNIEFRQFSNDTGGVNVSRYSDVDYSLALYGNIFDSFAGGGANSGSVILTNGTIDLNGSPNQLAVSATNNAQGNFTKVRYNFSRIQSVANGLSLFASLTGQYANTNLDSSEQFYLGGAYGVRAYPTNEGAGSQGQIVTLEIRQQLPQNVSINAFYDFGQVIKNVNNEFKGATPLNQFALQGAGVFLAWQSISGMNLKVIWARRLGSNPNQTALGTDQDGTNTTNRFWLIASASF